jgi:pimeloyl-ACP methyl ester carboxylesterase
VLWKILKYFATTIGLFIVVIPSSALLYRKYLQHKVAQRRAVTSPNGIDSLEAIRIGGIDQWIQVRGQDVNNPVLLFIHGGPGITFIPMASAFQDPWEKYFTVVQWDQRGAGKTYSSNHDEAFLRRTMTVPQMQQDTLEVANYLRQRFKREKIFVVGHSWGSVLGLWLAHEHPEMIYAYVGVGQLIDAQQNDQVAYQDALQQAHAHANRQAIQDLESLAPYPPTSPDAQKGGVARFWEAKLLGPPAHGVEFTNIQRILTSLISTPEYSLQDDLSFIHGQRFSLNQLIPQISKINLKSLGEDFRIPMFFFEGKFDPDCRPSLVLQYEQTIRAPQKAFVTFENSGHFPFFEEPQKFTDELAHRVLPMATHVSDANRL